MTTTVNNLATAQGIDLTRSLTRSGSVSATTVSDCIESYALVSNIKGHFAEGAVKLLVSSSVFNPASFPAEESALPEYGKKEV